MAWDETRERKEVVGAALVGKALRLVEVIGGASGPLDVHRMQVATGWPRATVYRILSVLAGEGYVRREPGSRGYRLGYRFLELAQNAWAGSDLAVVASLDLQRLRNVTGETAYLAVPQPDGVLSLGKFESPHAFRSAAQLGALKPYHCTSQGKAMLAYWDAAEVQRRVGAEPYKRYTPGTIVARDALERQLVEVRAYGFAIEDEEILEGRRCVGAPILDGRGHSIGAISVAGPAWRLTRERAEQLGPEVAEVARHIGRSLQASRPSRQARPGEWAVCGDAEPAFSGADPFWDVEQGSLRWVDRLGQAMHMTGPVGDSVWHLPSPEPIHCAVHFADGSLVFTREDTWRFARSGEAQPLDLPVDGVSAACIGAGGTVWIARAVGDRSSIGRLEGATIHPVFSVAGQVGALCCGADGSVLAADPERGILYAGRPDSARMRVLSRIPAASGQPRALALDASNRLWVALHDGWAVARLDADGEFAETIPLPIPRPTGLAVGGPQGRTLFVTTARYALSPETLRQAPLSGFVLYFDLPDSHF